MTTATLLEQLRHVMAEHHWDGLIVPSSDEFLSEYVPPHLNRRQALTRFTGSAGDVLVTSGQAWLFVDGRYHQQAGSEVDTAQFTISKLGAKQPNGDKVLALPKQLAATAKNHLDNNDTFTLAYPANCITYAQLTQWQEAVKKAGIEPDKVVWQGVAGHPFDSVWPNRPAFTPSPWVRVSDQAAGKTAAEKLTNLRNTMAKANVTHYPLVGLDEIAWLFNIRGNDIAHTPVGFAAGWVTPDEGHLFVETMDERLSQRLGDLGITVHTTGSHQAWQALAKTLNDTHNVWLDKKRCLAGLWTLVDTANANCYKAPSAIEKTKAVKNSAEQHGMAEAHLAASVALITVWHRLETVFAEGHPVTEGQFSQWLTEAYSSHPAFQQLSFPSIVGAGANGAIVHYHTGESTTPIPPGELLLFDSGAQYYCDQWMGTTDTTRTVLAGEGSATPEQRLRYTQVLKAHLNLGRQVFPKGTTGAQLDVVCRLGLWQSGVDFLHGTGHGVGCYLGVHEGPCGVGKGYQTAFEPGMITSNEPGYYQAGWGGIRLENLMVCVESNQTLSTTNEAMLRFNNLIWVPFDNRLIEPKQLTQDERAALNTYHQGVLARVLPKLDASLSWWLMDKCKEL